MKNADLTAVEANVLVRKYFNENQQLKTEIQMLQQQLLSSQCEVKNIILQKQILVDTVNALLTKFDDNFQLKNEKEMSNEEKDFKIQQRYIEIITEQQNKINEQSNLAQKEQLHNSQKQTEEEKLTQKSIFDTLFIEKQDSQIDKEQQQLDVNFLLQSFIKQ